MLTLIAAAEASADAPLVPLIKLEYPGNPPNIRMLYVRVLALGDRAVDAPLLFDTGSAGVTIACEAVLPLAYCSTDGIDIVEPLELDGLMVTPIGSWRSTAPMTNTAISPLPASALGQKGAP